MAKKIEENDFINDITRISCGALIKGAIISKSDIRIDGTLEGNILLEGKLVLGEKARIVGKIVCKNADIWGTIEGDIYVKERLEFKSVSNMKGNIKTSQLHIEAGALFNGTCEMIDEAFYNDYYNKFSESPEPKD